MELAKSLGPVLRLPLRLRRPATRPVLKIITTPSVRFDSTLQPSPAARAPPSSMASLITKLKRDRRPSPASGSGASVLANDKNAPLNAHPQERQPWHLHIFAHKHNTHITLTRPNRKSVISISAGNIGFRKSQRGSYDAAFQLGSYMMARINRAGLLPEINQLEIVFRGFGTGREAMGKILLGSEGSALRPLVTRVSDATRLKFGGTRSPKPRRLG